MTMMDTHERHETPTVLGGAISGAMNARAARKAHKEAQKERQEAQIGAVMAPETGKKFQRRNKIFGGVVVSLAAVGGLMVYKWSGADVHDKLPFLGENASSIANEARQDAANFIAPGSSDVSNQIETNDSAASLLYCPGTTESVTITSNPSLDTLGEAIQLHSPNMSPDEAIAAAFMPEMRLVHGVEDPNVVIAGQTVSVLSGCEFVPLQD